MADQFGSESPLSGTWRPAVQERAVLVGLVDRWESESLDELAGLTRAAGGEPVGRVTQARKAPDPATFVGRGKLGEIHDLVHASEADAVILDSELTPGQLRNLEERLAVKVLDRTALILDIFALHARSGEGKAQVELAQLNYLLPRLRGWGEAMSPLGGGIVTRGPGETRRQACTARAIGHTAGGAGRIHQRRKVDRDECPHRRGRAGGGPTLRHARPDHPAIGLARRSAGDHLRYR